MTTLHPDAKRSSAEGGFALVAVLLVLAIIGILSAEFAYSMRLEARAALTYKESVLGLHLAEAGVQNALRELVGQGSRAAMAEDGQLTFYTTGNITAPDATPGPGARRAGLPDDSRSSRSQPPPSRPDGASARRAEALDEPRHRANAAVPRPNRENVAYGGGHYSYRITDEAARLNVNTVTATSLLALDRLLQSLGIEKSERDIISDSIQDWRDGNDSHRVNGAESDDYYLKLPVPYRARNGILQSINELLQIKGVTPELFRGTAERPGLAEFLTVATPNPGPANINTASRRVLAALGLAEAEIVQIVATRQEVPYAQVPGQFARAGLTAQSTTYRIEAEGRVDGKVRAKVTAIVRKVDQPRPSITVLDWWMHR
jgi:type II secretory pathway component PulK